MEQKPESVLKFQRGIYKVWDVQAKFDYTFQEVQCTLLYTNIWMLIVLKGTVSKC